MPIESSIRATSVQNSTIVGVQVGLNEDAVARMLDERLRSLLPPSLTRSLYLTESEYGYSIAFAINNSGLLVVAAGHVDSQQVRRLSDGEIFSVEPAGVGSVLSALRLQGRTTGLVGCWLDWHQVWPWSGRDDVLKFTAFGEDGRLYPLQATAAELDGLQVKMHDGRVVAYAGLLECEQQDGAWVQGPVFNQHDEVCGVVLANGRHRRRFRKRPGLVYIAPWVNFHLDLLTDARVMPGWPPASPPAVERP